MNRSAQGLINILHEFQDDYRLSTMEMVACGLLTEHAVCLKGVLPLQLTCTRIASPPHACKPMPNRVSEMSLSNSARSAAAYYRWSVSMLAKALNLQENLARSSWRPSCKSCLGRWHVCCKAGERLHEYIRTCISTVADLFSL